MTENMGFIRAAAPDGIHDTVEFNEYRGADYWTAKALRRDLLRRAADRLAPFAILASLVAAFAFVGTLEAM